MNETSLTVVGNLTGDPELRFTASGVAVADFTVASTPRRYDRDAGEWVDGDTLFLRCAAWRELGEHIAVSLTRGTRVVVTGRLRQHTWETSGGEKRTSFQLDVDELGPSLKWATVKVTKTTREKAPLADNSWEIKPKPQSGNGSGEPVAATAGAGGSADEPPF